MFFDRPTAPTPTPSKPFSATTPSRSAANSIKAAADPGYTRLHITPFDADLLTVVVPSSARPTARNISFHSLETFPEKRYGFVDLPTETADKLKQKLNGAVLKGVKLRIEPARQSEETRRKEEEEAKMGKDKYSHLSPEERERKDAERAARKEKKRADKATDTAKAKSKSKKGGPTAEELTGVQLEPGRQVKRGWTEPESAAEASTKKTNWSKKDKEAKKKEEKQAKRAEKSEYTDKPECLFKTILPASKVAAPATATKDKDGEEIEVDGRAARKARKEAKKAREVVVHEFANWTRIPTFLKGGAAPSAGANLEYVDGKGWVDESTGDVVQPLKSTRPVAVTGVITKEAQLAKRAKLDALAAAREAEMGKALEPEVDESESSDSGSDTSSSGSDSSSEEEEDSEEEAEAEEETVSKDEPVPSAEADLQSPTRPRSSGSAKNLMIKIPPPPSFATPSTPASKSQNQAEKEKETEAQKEVHPLEALYKRAKSGDEKKEVSTPATEKPFSFFGGLNNDDIEEEDSMDVDTNENNTENGVADDQPPMTPFGRAEFEWRNVRSAAPTPDTAHPSRMTSNLKWPTPGGASDDEDEDEEEEEETKEEEGGDKDKKRAAGEGDFQSWFWDNRGDLNRSWKRRRKTAAKDKRYRENRARAERAI